MPAPTAASISPDRDSSYPAELKERVLQVSSEYRQVLLLLEADIEESRPAVFAEHIKMEQAVFSRFEACIKVWKGLKISDSQIENEIRDTVLRQRHLQTRISREKNLLHGRLEKGTLPPRPRRLYDEDNMFVDISC